MVEEVILEHKRVQFPRNTTAASNNYIGRPGEITIDMTRKEFRIHDGSKKGGHRVPGLSALSALFISVDSEAGRINFNSGEVGMLVRVSDDAYAVRSIIGKDGIEVKNEQGLAGNVEISLPPRLDPIAGNGEVVSSDENANLLVSTGFYTLTSTAVNIPTELQAVDSITLMTIQRTSTEITQLAMNLNKTMNIWVRAMVAGTWQAWVSLKPLQGTDEILLAGKDDVQRTWTAQMINELITDRLQDIGTDVTGTKQTYGGSVKKFKDKKNGPEIPSQILGAYGSVVHLERWIVYLSSLAQVIYVGNNFNDRPSAYNFVGGNIIVDLEIAGVWTEAVNIDQREDITKELPTTIGDLRFLVDVTNSKIYVCNSDWVTMSTLNGLWSGRFRIKTANPTIQIKYSGYRFRL